MNRIFSLILCVFIAKSLLAQTDSQPLKITSLTGDFYVFTTYQTFAGKRVSANGLYFLTNDGVVMIDTPWDTIQFQPLLDSIEAKHQQKVILCIATHSHEDRTGGFDFLKAKGVKTYSSEQTYNLGGDKKAEFYFTKDTTFNIGEVSFQTFYGGQGHTKDNIVIWIDGERILYAGCLIKSVVDTDLGNISEANLPAWPHTLNKIKRKFPEPKFIITGHYDWTSVNSLNHTLNLLQKHTEQAANKN